TGNPTEEDKCPVECRPFSLCVDKDNRNTDKSCDERQERYDGMLHQQIHFFACPVSIGIENIPCPTGRSGSDEQCIDQHAESYGIEIAVGKKEDKPQILQGESGIQPACFLRLAEQKHRDELRAHTTDQL